MLPQHKRQTDMTRNQREGYDWSDIDTRLLSWSEKRPVCYIRRMLGYDVNAYHTLELCQDKQRDVIILEIAKFQETKYTVGECCQTCAVSKEMCSNNVYSSIKTLKSAYITGLWRRL